MLQHPQSDTNFPFVPSYDVDLERNHSDHAFSLALATFCMSVGSIVSLDSSFASSEFPSGKRSLTFITGNLLTISSLALWPSAGNSSTTMVSRNNLTQTPTLCGLPADSCQTSKFETLAAKRIQTLRDVGPFLRAVLDWAIFEAFGLWCTVGGFLLLFPCNERYQDFCGCDVPS